MGNFLGKKIPFAAVCDVDETHARQAAEQVSKAQGTTPEIFKDYRKLLERKDIDAVIIATPDHWHALPFIAACEAGKDVYLEKPISHNITEGRAMVAAAKRFNRVVQVGTWQRSTKDFVDAIEYVRSGKLGKIATVKAWKTDNFSMGRNAPRPVPSSLDWDFWLGPAKMTPYTGMNGHFNWRWYYNTAAGNTGDWGVHMMDIGLLGMSRDTDLPMPLEVASFGGKYASGEEDDRTTPDTQLAVYKFKDWVLHGQTGRRGQEYGYSRQVPAGDGGPQRPPQDMLDNGTAFIATDGKSLVVWRGGWMVRDPQGNELPKAAAENFGHYDHMRDWIECIQSRRQPRSNIASMYQTTAVCHLANIAYLTGQVVRWDKEKDDIVGSTGKDTLPYAREYRKPWKLPIYRV
ncbi:MAG TPA: Gfo/Idh/MocA family oxidoreductase, partial [Armatimonadota bacterium]|nr:Gfo/Idh/MocA family oxidoreductase [Armatimonadota bacterium]